VKPPGTVVHPEIYQEVELPQHIEHVHHTETALRFVHKIYEIFSNSYKAPPGAAD
jgi:hypothetical protein